MFSGHPRFPFLVSSRPRKDPPDAQNRNIIVATVHKGKSRNRWWRYEEGANFLNIFNFSFLLEREERKKAEDFRINLPKAWPV